MGSGDPIVTNNTIFFVYRSRRIRIFGLFRNFMTSKIELYSVIRVLTWNFRVWRHKRNSSRRTYADFSNFGRGDHIASKKCKIKMYKIFSRFVDRGPYIDPTTRSIFKNQQKIQSENTTLKKSAKMEKWSVWAHFK